MIENTYLIFKGYTYLSLLHFHSGNHRSAKALAKYALQNLDKNERKNLISDSIILKNILIYINTRYASGKNINKDKHFLNFEKDLDYHLESLKINDAENLSKPNLLKMELYASKLYQEAEFSLNMNSLFYTLEKINKGINYLEENKYRNNYLAHLYLKKWAIEIFLGREATSSYYLEESQKIINSCYSVDSFKNIDFLRNLIVNALNIYPPKIDLAKEILRKTKKVTEEINCNSLQQKFYNIAVSLRTHTGVAEVFNLYEDILNTNRKYFNKDSELIFELKDILKSSKLAFIYKNKQDI